MTGVNTVLADDPALTARVGFPVRQPVRVVLDSRLRMPVGAQMAKQAGRTLILTCSPDLLKRQALQAAGFEVHQLPAENGRLELPEVLGFLAKQQINEVLVEAGAILNGALLAGDLLDELRVYMAPCVLGDQGRGLFHIPQLLAMADKKGFSWQDVRHVGRDLRLTLTPCH